MKHPSYHFIFRKHDTDMTSFLFFKAPQQGRDPRVGHTHSQLSSGEGRHAVHELSHALFVIKEAWLLPNEKAPRKLQNADMQTQVKKNDRVM